MTQPLDPRRPGPAERAQATAWWLDQPGTTRQDEVLGFLPNDLLDRHGAFAAWPEHPTYDGEEVPTEWMYIDLVGPTDPDPS